MCDFFLLPYCFLSSVHLMMLVTALTVWEKKTEWILFIFPEEFKNACSFLILFIKMSFHVIRPERFLSRSSSSFTFIIFPQGGWKRSFDIVAGLFCVFFETSKCFCYVLWDGSWHISALSRALGDVWEETLVGHRLSASVVMRLSILVVSNSGFLARCHLLSVLVRSMIDESFLLI